MECRKQAQQTWFKVLFHLTNRRRFNDFGKSMHSAHCTEVLLLCSLGYLLPYTLYILKTFNEIVNKYLTYEKRSFRVHHNVVYWDDISFRLKSSVEMQLPFHIVDAYLYSYQVCQHKHAMWKHRQSVLQVVGMRFGKMLELEFCLFDAFSMTDSLRIVFINNLIVLNLLTKRQKKKETKWNEMKTILPNQSLYK